MTLDEILSAAKEAGLRTGGNGYFAVSHKRELEAFAKSIERKTIDRCAAECDDRYHQTYMRANRDCATAIRKLGEE
jgi:hypothetical protein